MDSAPKLKKKILVKAIILGDSCVGKSSLMSQYVNHKHAVHYRATIGADFLTKEIQLGDQIVSLQIWDTAGQERFQSLGVAFYRGADVCMIVFDVTSPASFKSLDAWRDEFLVNASPRTPIPLVLVANKIDLDRQVFRPAADDWITGKEKASYFETSVKQQETVDKAFEQMAKDGFEYATRNDFSDSPLPIVNIPQAVEDSGDGSGFSNSAQLRETVLTPTISKKPVADWDENDVGDLLDLISMSTYKTAFAEHHILGDHLSTLTSEELKEIGVRAVGHRKTLLKVFSLIEKEQQSF